MLQQRGLSQLQAAGISAILDHHALPGVQTAGQQFTGRCTNDVEFYVRFIFFVPTFDDELTYSADRVQLPPGSRLDGCYDDAVPLGLQFRLSFRYRGRQWYSSNLRGWIAAADYPFHRAHHGCYSDP